MDQPAPSLRGFFLKSPHHAWMGLATLSPGIVLGDPLYLLVGAAAYGLGWIYLPDMGFFRRWVESRQAAQAESAQDAETRAFIARRDAMVQALLPRLRQDYNDLAAICRDIEKTSSAAELGDDARLRKLDELMWMYLRLLTSEQSLVMLLETERGEPLAEMVVENEAEVAALQAEVESLKAASTRSEPKERLLASRQDRLAVLKKRAQRVEEAEHNLQFVRAEEERLVDQIKLIRAEAVAPHNGAALSAQINASVAQLNETGRWLAEMEQLKSLTAEPPLPARRVGFGSSNPPPLPGRGPAQRQQQRS